MAKKRELVPTHIRTEFGDVLDDPKFYDTMGAAMDMTYVPGYSDMRRARDQAIAEVQKGERKWKDVPTIPVRLQWTRTSKVISGQPDNTKEILYGSQHYRFVPQSDVGAPWMKSLPVGAVVQADGTLKNGDTTLMVCTAEHAARNAATNAKAIERQHKNTAQDDLREPNAGFTVESEAAPQIAAPPSRIK